MQKDMTISKRLKETGIPDDMILEYQHYLDSGNKQGQRRLLCKFRKMQNDALKRDREKLAFLDYIIVRIEKTEGLYQK